MDKDRSGRAIIVLDMVNEIIHIEGKHFEQKALAILPYVQGEIQYFRERGRPIIFCNSKREEGFGQHVIQALSPRSKEICLIKPGLNAFFNTDLFAILTELQIKTITIVGVFTNENVVATALSALDHGFSIVVPETCVGAREQQDQLAALRLIHGWLS